MQLLENGTRLIEKNDVKIILPHRWPWNLVKDAFHNGEQTWTTVKFSAFNLLTFGHFPIEKVLPGVLLLEVLNQTAAIRAQIDNLQISGLPFSIGFDGVKFHATARPGDLLIASVKTTKSRHPFYFFSGKITNENGEMIVSIKEIKGCAYEKKSGESLTESHA